MIIYDNTKIGFLNDVDSNALQSLLEDAFKLKTGGIPSDRRVWADEYRAFSRAVDHAKIDPEVRIAIEYHLSAVGRFRIDVLMAGNDGARDNGLIVELKAWDRAEVSDVPDMVTVPWQVKPTQHPCVQARGYRGLIINFNQSINDNQIGIHSSAYLYNLRRRTPEPLEDKRYDQPLADARLFLANDVQSLQKCLETIVPHRPQKNVFWFLENGTLRPSKELMECVRGMLDGNREFDLIDDQKEAFEIIRHAILTLKSNSNRHVFAVRGGPGTGKSVIAVQLLAEVVSAGRMVCFVAPNRAFRDTLVEYLARGDSRHRSAGSSLFRSSWNFHAVDSQMDKSNDVLIIDEAHRLKDKAYRYYGKNMVDDLVRAARISVFFIDEGQRIAWNDIGSTDEIQQAAKRHGAEFHEPMTLTAQFRCNGSTGYLNWLDDALQIRATGNFENWGSGQYDFRVYDDALHLYESLCAKNRENKARLIAGYAWEWPKVGRGRSGKVTHIKIGDLELPWNYYGETWATAEDGIGQVGCIHTCQGLEFDWVGILIGGDLAYENGRVVGRHERRAKTDKSLQGWKRALRECNGDPKGEQRVYAKVYEIIKNTYRVLLTRGRKGCFVWCEDAALGNYLRQRLQIAGQAPGVAEPTVRRTAIIFENALPLLDLRAVAKAAYESVDGYFGSGEGFRLVPLPGGPFGSDRFLVRAEGDSMAPKIPPGSLCLFRRDPGGTRNGKIVLCRIGDFAGDAPIALIKRYRSVRGSVPEGADGGSSATRIVLSSFNPAHRDISLVEGGNFQILGVFERLVSEGPERSQE